MRVAKKELLILLLLLLAANCLAEETGEAEFFESRIRPVLVAQCYECHAADSKEIGGEFLLDSRDGLRKGGESGAAVEPGDPNGSLLVSAIRYDDLEMPPKGKLPDRVIADFERWVRHGAYDPREASSRAIAEQPSIDIEAGREFWSFQPPRFNRPPMTADTSWAERKIDEFILGHLEAEGISPADTADRRTLIRRLTFDVTGLPPTPQSVNEFLSDQRPDAYEQLVERLLASPKFGERWARLWLDVARYAEDQAHIVGNNDALFYPNAYLYREWLIIAFNEDMPFDRFVRLQIAADLLEPDDTSQHVALGFLGLGPKYYRRNAPEVMADEWEDRVDTVTRGFLGLTVACARCHDHKYDPIPTEDYYALAGVFASTRMFNKPLDPNSDQSKDAKKAAEAMHVVRDNDEPADIHVHIRGDAFNKGAVVPRRYLEVLSSSPRYFQNGSGRRELAETIASEDNPLTARVIVNRIWAQYFGKPLVSTPSNFGSLGGRPTHPDLLDDLAARFMRSGWSLKWLHREIVLSATYQQSSKASEKTRARDPSNRLLGRMQQRRLSIEMWRDAILSVTGELEDRIGGQSHDVHDPANPRRSVYSRVSRLELNSMLQMFDYPDPNVHAASRIETTTPLQKLFTLNNQFMVTQSEKLVSRLSKEIRIDNEDQTPRIRRAFELVYSRPPSNEETAISTAFLKSDEHWTLFAQALLASNELMYID